MQSRYLAATACLAVACTHAVAAPPLTLRYSVTGLSNGTHRYDFALTLDDPNRTWMPGDGYGWIIFGDRPNAPSDFRDWVSDADSLASGPWSFFTQTSGYNNGATLGNGRALWTPTRQGESVLWSGVSAALLNPDQLRWSCLIASYADTFGKPRGPIANFEPAILHCRADFTNDGFLTGEDFDAFIVAFALGESRADFNGDGFATGDDFDTFIAAFEAGC